MSEFIRRPLTEHEAQKAATLTNLVYSLAIVQEGYIKEVESLLNKAGQFRFQHKKQINDIKRNAELLRSTISRVDGFNAESFGEDSDTIEQIIKETLNSKNIEV